MTSFRNDAKGPRAIMLNSGNYEFLQPGETKTIDGSKVNALPPDVVEVDPSSRIEPVAAADQVDLDLKSPPNKAAADDLASTAIQGSASETVAAAEKLRQLDHDGDGKPGGSAPHDPPALSGMDREALEAQARKEGILIEHIQGTGANGNVLVADIRNAIEAKRKSDAAA